MSDGKRKLAILDIDNTLLDYTSAFRQWCIEYKGLDWVDSHEYCLKSYLPNITCDNEMLELVKEFAVSDAFMYLEPNPYAKAYVEELKAEGYNISVMSSFKNPDNTARSFALRWLNLKNVFGMFAFDYYDFLNLGESKKSHVEMYCDSFDEVLFVDDNPKVLEEVMSIEADNLTVLAWSKPYNEHLEDIGRISIRNFIEEE